jgi:hypothetical protein
VTTPVEALLLLLGEAHDYVDPALHPGFHERVHEAVAAYEKPGSLWLVTSGEYSGFGVEFAMPSEEAAEAWCQRVLEVHGLRYDVQEVRLVGDEGPAILTWYTALVTRTFPDMQVLTHQELEFVMPNLVQAKTTTQTLPNGEWSVHSIGTDKDRVVKAAHDAVATVRARAAGVS